MKKTFFATIYTFITLSIFAQNLISTQPHYGKVNSGTFAVDGSFYTAGEDGFVIKWTSDNQGEHYQISDLDIKRIVASPNGTDIAIYETDGYTINRISVWNWKTKKRIFVKRITDAITDINFSEKGTWLIVGTNSVEGVIFLNAKTGTIVRNKVKNSPGTISMAYTSKTEKSGVMYSPIGKLSYFNFTNGTTKQTLNVESNLNQPMLFNNDLLFAGVKGNYIYVYHSVTGDLLTKVYEKDATLVSNRKDSNLYYIVKDGKNYTLKMLQSEIRLETSIVYPENTSENIFNLENNTSDSTNEFITNTTAGSTSNTYTVTETETLYFNENPVIVKTFYTESRPEISYIMKDSTNIMALCNNGTVQKIDIEPNVNLSSMENISIAIYDKIYDIAAIDEVFYFLTKNNVFSSSYNDRSITTVMENSGFTNFLTYKNNFIFYNKNQVSKILITNIDTKTSKVLYTSKNPIQTIHNKDGYLLLVEGSSNVVLIDIENATSKLVYTGIGIQDALLYTENDIFIAKTAASSPNSALIHVDANTKETVIVPIDGEVAFSLSQSTNTNVFYGVCVYSGDTKRTDIFAYYPNNKHYTAIFQWGDEDTEAFTTFENGFLYSNIGKTQVRAVNISTRKNITLPRFASLPQKLEANSTLMVVLNEDGSISWYNAKTNSLYANWYVTVDGNWIEY